MEPQVVQTVLAGAILALLIWIARSVSKHGNDLTELRTLLVGLDGTNGLNSEVKGLRARSHTLSDEIHTAKGKHDLLEQRVGALEEKMA